MFNLFIMVNKRYCIVNKEKIDIYRVVIMFSSLKVQLSLRAIILFWRLYCLGKNLK